MNGDGTTDGRSSTSELLERVGDRSERMLARFTEGLSAATVFGAPERVDDRLVITAAVIERGGGWGFGAGGGGDEDDAGGEGGGGGGGGGGGRADARPVAVIEVGPVGVTVRPILDFTKVGLATLAGALAVWRAGRVGRRRG